MRSGNSDKYVKYSPKTSTSISTVVDLVTCSGTFPIVKRDFIYVLYIFRKKQQGKIEYDVVLDSRFDKR